MRKMSKVSVFAWDHSKITGTSLELRVLKKTFASNVRFIVNSISDFVIDVNIDFLRID